ncbi:hypothetical protein NIES4101_28910 [Calothrix sp. NIES-4101]|nr:hypothetical protein NIES4101_28910 [Calothrix sp. NIES-4101]
MECANGILACDNATKVKVEITIDEKTTNVELKAPLCITNKDVSISNQNARCWHFWGQTDGVTTFRHYACGVSAKYQPDPSLVNDGAWLVVDDVIQVGYHYFYWSGTHEGKTHARFLEAIERDQILPDGSGDCDNCNIAGCQIVITTEDGTVFNSKIGKKCSFDYSCDDNCPEEHVKCEKDSYPGYCCLPCASTAQKIHNLANRIK